MGVVSHDDPDETQPGSGSGSAAEPEHHPGQELPEADERDLTTGTWRRGARLLSVPLGYAGRGVVGFTKKATGRDAHEVDDAIREETARQVFGVLGELKGGAMKMGQALSMLQAALPDDVAEPYREQLRRLQAAAPPMPASRVHAVMTEELGRDWRRLFTQFSIRPAAAASIGQVHKAVWAQTGEPCAVKIQYPGADVALASDLKSIARLSSAIQPLAGGTDVRGLAKEMAARIGEEVSYEREARSQQASAVAFEGDPEVAVPHVLANTDKILVSEWIDGVPFLTAEGWDDERRSEIGFRYARFLFRSAHVSGRLHGDPHPGNFMIMPDGRLGVLDWGLTATMPELPYQMGRLLRLAATGDAEHMAAGLRAEGFVTRDIDTDELYDYLRPFVEPAAVEEFHFSTQWIQGQARRIGEVHLNSKVVTALNLPPSYMMIYRDWLGGVAVLCSLDCRARFRGILDEFLPGWLA